MSPYLLIPLSPLFAFLVIGLLGRWLREASHRVAIPAVSVSFALSVAACVDVYRNGPRQIPLYSLIQSGSLTVDTSLYLDAIAAVLLFLVTGVSTLVHIFSSRYMKGDPRYARFFAVIALFTSSMILLVMSGNLLMLYMCWEVMGLCSYLLIAHSSDRTTACQAATKAFLVNAVADVGLGFGIILTWYTFGTLNIQEILAAAPDHAGRTVNVLGFLGLEWQVPILSLLSLLLFMGAIGKSSQIPFHVWLPFAMEAPTPVSALIHAATMVNAGVYLLVRLGPLYLLTPTAMTVVAVIGGLTAFFAATVALTQTDIKRILAYSTMSQLGFMVLACGVGAYAAALLHLVTHGALKAFLFLSAGSALQQIHAPHHGESDARPRPLVRWRHVPRYAGALALGLVPPLIIFSGPYERLWTVTQLAQARIVFWVLGLATVFLAAFYLFRWIMELFQHPVPVEWREGLRSAEAAPRLFSASLLLGLIPATAGIAVLLMFAWDGFLTFLIPALEPLTAVTGASTPPEWSPVSLLPALGVAFGGWALAFHFHAYPFHPSPGWSERAKTLYVFFWNKGYFDELYEAAIVRPSLRFANWLWKVVDLGAIDRAYSSLAGASVSMARWLWEVIDVQGIDRMATGVGRGSIGMARWLWQMVDIKGVDRVFTGVGRQSDAAGRALRQIEPRMLQHHLLVAIFWLALGIGLFFWLIL